MVAYMTTSSFINFKIYCIFVDNEVKSQTSNAYNIQVCDATETDEGMYECCVTKDDVTDCVEIELQVLAVCDTDDEREFVVSVNYKNLLSKIKIIDDLM